MCFGILLYLHVLVNTLLQNWLNITVVYYCDQLKRKEWEEEEGRKGKKQKQNMYQQKGLTRGVNA